MELQSLEWNKIDNIPGMAPAGYWCPRSWITSFPESYAIPASMAELAMLQSYPGFQFKTGFGFLGLYGTEGKCKIEMESQGETDARSFVNKFTFLFPGSGEIATAFCRRILKYPLRIYRSGNRYP